MKRSLQEYVELVVFGLVALLVGTGLLWLVGWALSLGGVALRWVAGLLWTLLRFIVPVAIAGGLVYFLVKAAQDRQPKPATAPAGAGTPATGYAPPPPPPTTPASSGATSGASTGGAATGGASAAPTATDGPSESPQPTDTADGSASEDEGSGEDDRA